MVYDPRATDDASVCGNGWAEWRHPKGNCPVCGNESKGGKLNPFCSIKCRNKQNAQYRIHEEAGRVEGCAKSGELIQNGERICKIARRTSCQNYNGQGFAKRLVDVYTHWYTVCGDSSEEVQYRKPLPPDTTLTCLGCLANDL